MSEDGRPNVSGIFPHLCLKAGLGPPRSECGVGALMPWADRLWAATYVSSKSKSGVGTGLYEIDADLDIRRRPESYVGTYTNRLVHFESNQLFIGPWVIDADRNIRTVDDLLEVRVCSTTRHLTDPENKVYVLGMEGEFYELDVHSLEVTQLFDLVEELELPPVEAVHYNIPHFKAAHCDYGRVVVANNSYGPPDYEGEVAVGRLAEWDGDRWTILERKPFVEVTGRIGFGGTIFATGWDRASAILEVFTEADGRWTRCRLPKASHTFDHMWSTEWPRIREIGHERFLMDCHGAFYELFTWAYGNRVWGIRPIAQHLWVLGDFATYRGLLVLGSDDASPSGKANPLVGEPQSNLWFGKTDDLWRFGKPQGWGGPWWRDEVRAGDPSDPYLMTGFDHKVLHLAHEADGPVAFDVEVDFLGCADWHRYERFEVPAGGYVHHEFPPGFGAHWLRVTADRDCTASAYLHYT
ncbi:MAG: hypothetical protein R6V58_10600 [Planctomycetota bacterium]